MLYVFPDYYKDFKCINRECKHSCCIGWEIDIDENAAARYKTMDGEMGERLNKNIAWETPPHFILGENERCPFLNSENLCDLICAGGDEMLCSICADHPRFRCELPGRIETGLGLCCEAAGALILSQKDKVEFVFEGEGEADDEIISLRDEIIEILQNREKTISDRVAEMLERCETSLPEMSLSQWADFLLSLERLDETWTEKLTELKCAEIDFAGFGEYMSGRETEYEQLLVYLIYRHFANSPDAWEAAARAAFAAFGYMMIYSLGAVEYTKSGEFTFDDQVELCRLFSSEIEYSDENLYEVIEMMY